MGLGRLLAKAVIYRVIIVCLELVLAYVLVSLRVKNVLVLFILVDNALKIALYMIYDVLWKRRGG